MWLLAGAAEAEPEELVVAAEAEPASAKVDVAVVDAQGFPCFLPREPQQQCQGEGTSQSPLCCLTSLRYTRENHIVLDGLYPDFLS